MNSDTSPALWIKDTLAILADGAEPGVGVQEGRIVELVAAGREPRAPAVKTFDADAHVVLPGLINTHHHFYQTLTARCRPPSTANCFRAASALSALGAADAGGGRSFLDARHGRADAIRLHAHHGPSLRLSQGRRGRHRHPSRRREAARLARAADARLDEPLAAPRRDSAGQRGAGRGTGPGRL